MSTIGSPTHRLARELVRILSPLEGTTDSHVKNSTDFVNHIGQLTIQERDIMASSDVVSLFTRVPVDGALQVFPKLLLEDETLSDQTAIFLPQTCVAS